MENNSDIQWKPLIVITLVRSQYDHYKRLITITELSSKCHLYRFFNENNGNGQLQHLLNCIMVSKTVISNAPFEKRRASLITVLRGAQTELQHVVGSMCRRCILSRLEIKFETNCFLEQQHRK